MIPNIIPAVPITNNKFQYIYDTPSFNQPQLIPTAISPKLEPRTVPEPHYSPTRRALTTPTSRTLSREPSLNAATAMKVLNPRTAFLSDYEVLRHLTETKTRYIALGQSQGTAHAMKSSNLETIMKEVRDYLQTTPAATQSEEAISNFMHEISAFALEKAELLMMVNCRPSSIAELDCIVEEMDQRFSEEESAEMLRVVKRNLPPGPKEGEVIGSG